MGETDSNAPVVARAPRGFHEARVDEKGRLKLPAVFQKYLNDRGEKQVFITTLDVHTARLYPISVWEDNEKLFESAGDDAHNAETVSFIAKHYGADSEVDAQGRVLVPQELRKKLGLENQAVYLGYDKGAIEVYSGAMYQRKFEDSVADIPTSLAAMKKRGLK